MPKQILASTDTRQGCAELATCDPSRVTNSDSARGDFNRSQVSFAFQLTVVLSKPDEMAAMKQCRTSQQPCQTLIGTANPDAHIDGTLSISSLCETLYSAKMCHMQ